MQNVFDSIHSTKRGLSKMYLAAYIPQNVVNAKCVWQHTFHHTWFIQNVFDSIHSAERGLSKMCLRAYIPPYVVYTKCG